LFALSSQYRKKYYFFYVFSANRRFGQTNMNALSSRSHTIFRMVQKSGSHLQLFGDHITHLNNQSGD
jgi:hypothetical protein